MNTEKIQHSQALIEQCIRHGSVDIPDCPGDFLVATEMIEKMESDAALRRGVGWREISDFKTDFRTAKYWLFAEECIFGPPIPINDAVELFARMPSQRVFLPLQPSPRKKRPKRQSKIIADD